ncbi:hypothetical protein Forpe1208_v008662 [Fusarium oxysporum f. sp. rapae]|uniref:Uncharacterized protein n=1 Tax=Fusarium oxysporum f. sp. rapae TaxID=485398 RepID=A0A8J5NT64_FUSOX|nr:hypothetical protein Forpe1208_v008662 [Fusarium oxysporum f. sp. rapae]
MADQSLPSNLELEQFQWDETSPVVFPDTEAVMEQPDSPPPLPPTLPELPPWQELQKKVDLQVQKAAEAARKHLFGHLYAHLPCSEIDWSLDGGRTVCRMVGFPCYGSIMDTWHLKKHLLGGVHRTHGVLLALEWVGPVPSQTSTAPVSRPQGKGYEEGTGRNCHGKRKAAMDNGDSELEEPSSKKQKKVTTSS